MVPGIALLVMGGMLLYSGWNKKSLMAVFDGSPPDQLGGPDPSAYGVPGSSYAGPISPATGAALNTLQTAMGVSPSGSGVRVLDGHPVAAWIVPILKWAKANGWKGQVTSGYRTFAQQEQAASNYGLQHYGPGGAQGSNHRKTAYPGGAVDVTNPEQLNSVLQHYPGTPKLVWAGPIIGDTVHFSATGH